MERIIEHGVGRMASTLALATALAASVGAQVTQRMSLDSAGVQANDYSFHASLSADGRYVAFHSNATNLVAGDTNGKLDVFVRDRVSGITERMSVDSGGVQGDGDSFFTSITANGRYVAFYSLSTNLVPGDTNNAFDAFVHDRLTGVTERVSVDSSGAQGNGGSYAPSISADGRYVVFYGDASNLVPGDANQQVDVFLHDRQTGATTLVSVDSAGAQSDDTSFNPTLSLDNRFVGFASRATNLVPGDTNGTWDSFVRDLQTGVTLRISVDSAGTQGNAESDAPTLSADGRYAAFQSDASNLVANDTNAVKDVFVHDLQTGITTRVSLGLGGAQGDGYSYSSAITPDGRYVAFYGLATNLVPGDTNASRDVFLHDRLTSTTSRVSLASSGAQASADSSRAAITPDARFVVFDSFATDLVSGDTNGFADIFIRDRFATGFTSLCDPGTGGMIACPCANAPSGTGRGCDNSSATGGAVLTAGGVAYLALDSLVFTTSGEKPTATSILLQGDAAIATGAAFGQGVRCAGGALKRLFVKTAVGGSMSAPDFGAGDPTISARSAALGDSIQAGQSRWYLVYYRDPTILGGCSASSSFNATQTGVIGWWL